MVNNTRITDLDQHVLFEILCFLPAKYIIRCSCVCKDWANLIYQPYFPQLYFLRGKAPLQMVLERDCRMVLVQLDESLYTSTHPFNFLLPSTSIFDLKIPVRLRCPPRSAVLRSDVLQVFACNYTCWVVALDLYPYIMYSRDQQYYKTCPQYHIYNPITGQHIVVPKPLRYNVEWRDCALIFAQKSNQLKLLEFYEDKQGGTEAYMQTIGTKTWRRMEKAPCEDRQYVLPVLLNGHYHWFNCNGLVINSLDAEEEVVEVIQTPSSFMIHMSFYLGLLDGCLCLAKLGYQGFSEVWVMNQYGVQDSWTLLFVLDNMAGLGPLTFLKNGEILMLAHCSVYDAGMAHSAMICYNPHSGHRRYITNDHTIDEALRRLRMFH